MRRSGQVDLNPSDHTNGNGARPSGSNVKAEAPPDVRLARIHHVDTPGDADTARSAAKSLIEASERSFKIDLFLTTDLSIFHQA